MTQAKARVDLKTPRRFYMGLLALATTAVLGGTRRCAAEVENVSGGCPGLAPPAAAGRGQQKTSDPHLVRIEGEDPVVAGEVVVLFGWAMDTVPARQAALVGGLDLLASIDLERHVLATDLVVAVLTAVGAPARSSPR